MQREWTNAYSKANNITKDKHKLCFKLPDDNPQEKKARWVAFEGIRLKKHRQESLLQTDSTPFKGEQLAAHP